ncbi:uncharacterized protein TNIN_43491 [Trichonephila inaurata madagascariensis]|uniref:Uncharacterized protein n=1 Tax=Trichonephila inaurata madagascariensis TaxID=2747483 RepID=A0A8X6M969_9ARAC|nr:uncharacterized protein TNIN_43491 [Trichonephila inaurata madagascariensis]
MKSNPNQTFKKKEFRKPFPIKKNQPVGGAHDNHSPGPSRTVPRFPSYKTEGRNPIQCHGCGTPGVVKSKCPTCTRANEMETAVNLLPEAKGNRTLLGLDFLNAAGIVLDVQGGKWHFSGNPRKQYKFFKKTFENVTHSAFEFREHEVWATIHPISRNNRSRKFMPKREGLYLILTLRSPVIYQIADPANPNQALGTYHVSALKDYQESEIERNTGFVAPLRKRGRPKKSGL